MTKRVTLKSLLPGNPSVDPEQLKKTIALLKAVRRSGVTPAQYNLLSPYTRVPLYREEQGGHADPRSFVIKPRS